MFFKMFAHPFVCVHIYMYMLMFGIVVAWLLTVSLKSWHDSKYIFKGEVAAAEVLGA